MDYTQMADLYTDEELGSEQDQENITAIENALKDVHTCLPGIIKSYNPLTNTASVQPAIQRVFVETGPKNLPLIEDVPVYFPGGGDWAVTFPVAAGDECVLMIAERCIDFWHTAGGINPPSRYRFHDLSDAFAFVGIRSQPRKLVAVQSDGMELRNTTRTIFLKLTEVGIEIQGNLLVTGNIVATGTITP